MQSLAAIVLHLAALCWLTSPAVRGGYIRNSNSTNNQTTWYTAVIPQDGVYVVSAAVDPFFGSENESLLTVKVNGNTLYKVYAYGNRNSAATAAYFRTGYRISLEISREPDHEQGNRLTLCFIGNNHDLFQTLEKWRAHNHANSYVAAG